MSIKVGFFDSERGDPRTYGASDLSFWYKLFFSNGVYPTPSDSLQVFSVENMTTKVSPGVAIIDGKWLQNDADYIIDLAVGDITYARKDLIVVQLNNTARTMKILVKQGTPSNAPEIPELIRTDFVYEIALAEITVPKQAQSISQAEIKDVRQDNDLCGLVVPCLGELNTSTLWVQYETAWNNWFKSIKDDTKAKASLVRSYTKNVTAVQGQDRFNIDISGYNHDLDVLQVFANGLIKVENKDYVVEGNLVVFNGTFNEGDIITFVVMKSIATDEETETVVNDVIAIQNNTKWNNEHIYYCNGVNDNIKLSELAQDFLTGKGDYSALASDAILNINVVGQIGVSGYHSGTGTASNPFNIFTLGKFSDGSNFDSTASFRQIRYNFKDCSKIVSNSSTGAYMRLFGGDQVFVEGAQADISHGAYMSVLKGVNQCLKNCDITITGENDEAIVAVQGTGTFDNVNMVLSGTGTLKGFYKDVNGIMKIRDCYVSANSGYGVHCDNDGALIIRDSQFDNEVKIDAGKYFMSGNIMKAQPQLYNTGDGMTETGTMII
jgi:hypothetical protein